MIRYVFSTLILGLFLFYGIITLIFTFPDNFVNISLIEYSDNFNSFLYQRWAFFAPPPQSNDRLYYIFENKNKSQVIVYEVIEPLLKKKYIQAPFNSKEDLTDYLISNSIYLITDGVREVKESISYNTKLSKNKIDEHELTKKVNKVIKSTKTFETLLNYSKKVALKNNIKHDDYIVSLKITQIKIPKFIDRLKKNMKTEERLVFDSSF